MRSTRYFRPITIALLLLATILLLATQRTTAQSDDNSVLTEAWARTEQVGSYDFTTELTQTTHPAPRVSAVGRSAKYDTLYLEGSADRRAGTLSLSVWDDPATVLDDAYAIEMQIDGTTAKGRVAGGQWQDVENFSGAFAPTGDAAAFLNAADNVRPLGSESRKLPLANGGEKDVTFERYAFTIDGERYAEHMRVTLQKQLRENGELPAGVSLGTNDYFRTAIGDGEAWIDSKGMPLRMVINMEFAQERNGERTFLDLQTDFVSYNNEARVTIVAFASNPLGWVGGQLASLPLAQIGEAAAWTSIIAMIAVGAFMVVVYRPKKTYNVIATALSAQLLFSPLAVLFDVQTMAHFREQYPSAEHTEADPIDQLYSIPEPVFNPEQSPLEAGQQAYERTQAASELLAQIDADSGRAVSTTTSGIDADEDGLDRNDEIAWGLSDSNPDWDNDGLSDGVEIALCLVERNAGGNPASDPENLNSPLCPDPKDDDSDDDGLTDGEEILHLGTYANEIDSDGDGISDYNEVHGYVLVAAGTRYYTDVLNPDSDGDGILDGIECPTMRDADPWTATTTCEDTQNKGVADVNSLDNDGDGVPNREDNSPYSLIKPAAYLSRANPLQLNLQNLAQNEPVLVDLQIRPKDERHLSYALNILDWPTGDNNGQIRRLVDETFGDVNPDAPLDSPAHNGDMRLAPMLEFRMAASSLDLPRINASQSIKLTDAGVNVGFVTLAKTNDNNSTLTVDYLKASSATLTVRAGTCAASDVQLNNTVSQGSVVQTSSKIERFADGGHVLQLESNGETHCVPLPSIVEGSEKVAVQLNRSGAPIADIDLVQAGGNTNITFQYETTPAVYDARIYNSSCSEKTNLQHTFTSVAHGSTVAVTAVNAVNLADGAHVITLSQGNDVIACKSLGNIVNGSLPTMIDASTLESYQISVQEDVTGELLAMAPLTLQEDSITGQRVAMNGKMLYQRSTSAALQNTVNVVWLVTVLTDYCPDDVCTANGISQPQVIHQYRDEAWYVTGINVQEELGMDVAIVYEDPTTDVVVDTNATDGSVNANRSLEFDDNLWWLMRSLERSFISGQDFDNNGVRDLPIGDIKARWDSATSYTDDQRFGIRADALNVVEFQYEQVVDLGILNSVEIPAILNGAFGDGVFNETDVFGRATTTVAPTLLIAREERSRALGLDASVDGTTGNMVTVNGSAVTLNLNPTFLEPATVTSTSWKPFRYSASKADWEAFPLADYWDRLDALYTHVGEVDVSAENGDLAAQEAQYDAIADLIMAKNIYTVHYLGSGNVVQDGNYLTFQDDNNDNPSAAELADTAKQLAAQGQAFGALMIAYSDEDWEQLEIGQKLAEQLKGKPTNRLKGGLTKLKTEVGKLFSSSSSSALSTNTTLKQSLTRMGGKLKTPAKVTFTLSKVGVGIANMLFDPASRDSTERTVAITMRSVKAATEIADGLSLMRSFSKWKLKPGNTGGIKGFMGSKGVGSKAAKVGAVVGAVIEIGIAFGMFLSAMISAGVEAFSLAFNEALASFIGTAVVAVLLAALALTGVGAIVVLIIGIIDAVIALICGIEPPDEESEDLDDQVYSYFCKGITGLLAELVSFLIYDQTDIININDADRIKFLSFNPYLADTAAGFVPNATLVVDLDIRNTIETESPNGIGVTYAWQFNESNTRSAAFTYGIFPTENKDEDSQIHNGIDRGDHPNEWVDIGGDAYYIERNVVNATSIKLPSAGINKLVSAYFAEGYQSPTQECIMVPVSLAPPIAIPVCWVRTNDKSTYNSLGVVFDVLPETLTQFYQLSNKDGGKALSWGQTGDVRFSRMIDADNDGLHYSVDPDDGDRDNDNDGLDDLREVQLGTDPTKADTDADLVNDGDEIRNGTNPLRADSDSDGLDDAGERDGWMITYNLAGDMTQVWSDPLVGDADGDKISDRREKALGFSPWVSNDPTVLDYDTDLREANAPSVLIGMNEMLGNGAFADSSRPDSVLTASCSGETCPQEGVTGYIGNAAYFDGYDDYTTLGVVNEVNNTATPGLYLTSAWIKPSRTTGTQYVIGTSRFNDEDGFGFGLEGDELRFDLFVPRDINNNPQGYVFTTNGADIPINKWTHIAAWSAGVGNQRLVRFYVNGAFQDDVYLNTTAAIPFTSIDELMIGALYQLNTYGSAGEVPDEEPRIAVAHFEGRIDEVSVLTPTPFSSNDVADVVTKLHQRLYNPDDGIVAPGDELAYETNLSNRLLGRSVDGLLHTELPDVLSYAPGSFDDNYKNFVLGPRGGNDLESSKLRQVDRLQVDGAAATGDYTIAQTVGAIVDVPPIPVPGQFSADTVFRLTGEQTYDGEFQYRSYTYDDQIINSSEDFTLALWVKPDRFGTRTQGILGYDSGEADAYPSLQIDNGNISFGFGDGTQYQSDTTANSYLTSGGDEWTHIAVVYSRATKTAKVYIDGGPANGGFLEDLTYPTNPATTGSRLDIGRSTNIGKINFIDMDVKCEEDAGNAWFDLVGYTPSDNWFNIKGQSVPDDTEDEVFTVDKQVEFREFIRFAMCENDGDGSNHNTCDSDDDYMSSVAIALFDDPAAVSDSSKRFSTTMHNSTCTFLKGYDDWATLNYQVAIDSEPYEGTIKDIRLIKRAISAPEVTDLLQSETIISRFKFDERPGQRTFEDDVGALSGSCQYNIISNGTITGCPVTGVDGRENVAARFTSDADDIRVQYGGNLIKTHTDLAEATGYSYGAWVNLDADNGTFLDRAIVQFSGWSDWIELLLVETSPGSGNFKLRYRDAIITLYSFNTISANSWHHVFVTVSKTGQVVLYVDGVYSGTSTSSCTVFNGECIPEYLAINGPLIIGQWFQLSPIGIHHLSGVIDDLYIGKDVLTQAQVQAVMDGVPNERQTFDDIGDGNDSFIVYLEGQIAESKEFRGGDDAVLLDGTAADYNLWEGDFTVAGWVRGDALTDSGSGDVYRPIIGSGSSSSSALFIGLRNGKPLMRFHPNWNSGGTVTEIEAAQSIPPEQWTHLTFMRDNGTIKIFVNGTEVISGTHNVSGQYDDFLALVGFARVRPTGESADFVGRIDDLAFYERALIPEEVVRLFNFQVTWIDEKSDEQFAVDADQPTGSITLPDFMPKQATVLLIEAEDVGSQPVATLLAANHYPASGPTVTLTNYNSACLDSEGGSVFCSNFNPPVEGRYYLGLTVFDQVGNSSGSVDAGTVIVDGSAPVITPTISTSPLKPTAVPDEAALWTIDLAGVVLDPEIFYVSGNAPGVGSGVADLRVTLLDANGAPVGEPVGQVAEINNDDWAMAYVVQAENPTGLYTAKLVATDNVGNVSAEKTYEVIVDGTAPAAEVTSFNAPQVTIGSGRMATTVPLILGATDTIDGLVDETPVGIVDQGVVAGIDGVQVSAEARFPHGSPVINSPLPSGTRLYLPFDEADATDGDSNDSYVDLVSGHVASCASALLCPTAGNASRNGQAVQFDGVNDRLTVPHDASITGLTNNFVVAAWIKPYATLFGQSYTIVGADPSNDTDGYVFKTIGSQLALSLPGVQDYQTNSASLINDGVWTHVAAHLKADNSVDFYMNGRLVSNVSGGGPAIADSNDALTIGALATGADAFEGLIDEVVVMSGSLAADDLNTLMGLAPSLHLTFDQRGMGDGSRLSDSAGMGGYAFFDDGSASNGSPDHTEAGMTGGGALRFDRSDELEIRGDESVLLNDVPFTLSFWVRDGYEFYIDFGDIEIRKFNNSDFLRFYDRSGSDCRSQPYDPAGVHHIAFVADGVTPLKMYRNGVDVSPTGGCMVVDQVDNSNIQQVNFYKVNNNSASFDLDDVRFYQRALSAEEIATMLPQTWQDATVALRKFVTADAPIAIPDDDSQTEVCQTINVNGVGSTDLSEIVVQPVINHTYAGDLTITLAAPNNARYTLNAGQNTSADYLAAFPLNYYEGAPTDAALMGSGLFNPGDAACRDDGNCNIQPASALNGAVSADGTWELCTVDDISPDSGTIESWSMTFKQPAKWSSGFADGLEGYYDLLVRGADEVGNVDEEPAAEWSGTIDTVKPRVLFTETVGSGTWSYRLSATDFNLNEATVSFPAACAGNITTHLRELYQSPWYLAFAAQAGEVIPDRVVAMDVECVVSTELLSTDIITACDTAGNCVYLYPDGSAVPTAITLAEVSQAQSGRLLLGAAWISALLLLAVGWLVGGFGRFERLKKQQSD